MGILGGEGSQRVIECQMEGGEGSGFESAEALFDLRPASLDGVEVWRVGWQIEQGCSCLPDEFFHAINLMRGEVVHNHDLTGFQLWAEHVFQISEEDVAIGGGFQRHGGDPTVYVDGAE